MPKVKVEELSDLQLATLINNRWDSSSTLWEEVEKTYKRNTAIYENKAEWLSNLPHKRKPYTIQANRIFTNMEAVINSLIANPPGLNVLPARSGEIAEDFARKLENFFRKKYLDLNVKETFRMGLRNVYFARLVVLKPHWNSATNDFDLRSIDPRKIRVGKYARKEQETEFVIEEIEDNLYSIIQRFPDKKKLLMKKYGFADDAELYIKNPEVKYKEAWINDYVCFKLDSIILGKLKNPYWDWDGLMVTKDEYAELEGTDDQEPATGDARRNLLETIRNQQETRKSVEVGEHIQPTQGATSEISYEGELEPYYFNYFDAPRKPYIFATIFNNENSPIGRTDMITLSAELQKGIDKRKMDIDENCELANGIIKIDSSVMDKSDAQRIRFETKGIIFGKGVVNGVQRETGGTLPQMVFEDMKDSREEIDNIMAASSAFRGERQGQETKAGRLALIQQSYLRLNELVQVVDYLAYETFSWFMQLAKTRYTEPHFAKWVGEDDASEIIELMQDDFVTGTEIKIIAGKTLPEDDEFRFLQAQNDVAGGYIAPIDYLKIANYDNARELARNAVLYQINPMEAVGLAPDETPMPGVPGQLTTQQQTEFMGQGVPPPGVDLPQVQPPPVA